MPEQPAGPAPVQPAGPPRLRRSIATVSLSGTLQEKLAAASRAGFDGVEVFENDLIASPWSPAEVRRRAADLGLSIDLYQPFRDLEAVPDELFRTNLRRAEHKFDVMEQLDAPLLLVCSSVHPAAVDDDALAAAQLHALAERAAARGLRVAYEALAWGRHVDDYRHAWDIVRAGDHPALGTCLDSFHILSRDSDASGIRDLPGEKVFFLQLADAPQLVMDVLQWSRHYRCFPGQGGFDLPLFLDHVLATGYRGPLSLEVFNDVFRQASADRTAIDAMRSLLTLEEAVQVRYDPVLHGAGPERLQLSTPPAAVQPDGVAFVEVAVDAASSYGLEEMLGGMGFQHVGEHRSKPVQLWQQGDARVLVNRADQRLVDVLDGDALLSALALEVADPTRSARRAEQLLAPVLPRRHGADEADLSAVAAPDGTSIFFCRTSEDPASGWLADFVPVGGEAPQPGAALTGVDHVALSQPFDHFDEAALFYRSVLGLQPQDGTELAAPYGLVRSRALCSINATVRIALNVSLLGRGGTARNVPEPQHVAFGCADALAAAAALRSAGAELLAIPDNYYADLDARYDDLGPDLLERMRACGVLYDRTSAGAFFHFYTPMVGRRLFLEVVQRVGGYDGFGAANAPVRMTAQRGASARW